VKARVVSLEIKVVLRTVLVLIHLIQDAILVRKASLELEAVLREESCALQRGTIGNESCTAVISCIEQNYRMASLVMKVVLVLEAVLVTTRLASLVMEAV